MAWLVTGSNGLIGSSIITKLKPLIPVTGMSKGDNRLAGGELQNYCDVDLSDTQFLNASLQQINPDGIIHCGAWSQVDRCESNPSMCNQINVEAAEVIVRYAKSQNIPLVVFSTDFVFGGDDAPYGINDSPKPLSCYAESKVNMELIAASYKRTTIIRPVLVYGYTYSMRRDNIFSWVAKAIQKKESIQVVNDQFRNPTYVADLADFIALNLFTLPPGVVHLGGNERLSVYQLALEIARIGGFDGGLISPVSSDSMQGANLRPADTTLKLDSTKRIDPQWESDLERGIARAWKSFRSAN